MKKKRPRESPSHVNRDVEPEYGSDPWTVSRSEDHAMQERLRKEHPEREGISDKPGTERPNRVR